VSMPIVRFRIDFATGSYVGPGKIELLEAIRDSGSLSQAARNISMSYRRAWLLLESLNASFREPVTVATTGGRGGGGVTVSEFGLSLIKRYRELEKDIATLAVRRLQDIVPAVHPHSTARTGSPRRPVVHRRKAARAA
jgi:molybdate transport system regulatory protein